MKKVIISGNTDFVHIDEIEQAKPIFAKTHNKLAGMIVKESEGWILKIGGRFGSTGHHTTRADCIRKNETEYGYSFYIEE